MVWNDVRNTRIGSEDLNLSQGACVCISYGHVIVYIMALLALLTGMGEGLQYNICRRFHSHTEDSLILARAGGLGLIKQ